MCLEMYGMAQDQNNAMYVVIFLGILLDQYPMWIFLVPIATLVTGSHAHFCRDPASIRNGWLVGHWEDGL